MSTETITQTSNLVFSSLPPFPSTVPTAPLHRLSLQKLRTDPEESARLFSSAKDLGFFYLDLRSDYEGESLLQNADELFSMAPKLYDLGREELTKYDHKSKGSYMGYKGFGSAVVDEEGNLDRNEFYNIPKDDLLGISSSPFAQPQIVHDHKDIIVSYMNTSHSLVTLILQNLAKHLHLPPETLTSVHRKTKPSGDQVRLVKSPPQPPSDQRTALGKHTDFGSITILFNRLGGLQILPPPSLTPAGQEPQWTYVKPLPGHCIVNLGDAMVKFTNGLLRSNIHRVVSPPGEQAKETRYSVVYFARPEEDVILRRLEGSDVIPELEGEEESMSSKEWIKLQAMRLRNIKAGMSDEERKKLWKESGRGE
ncbi:hypothetical protein BKA65DRAFT_155520 [Rhexocercosporidium sp. MPI-PUGE-AT-0058]|nr:hypothetical protein BKA65DRAFT_155520 [Rhexocercosporidium sp. MPI-PUGE-AT-0058]